MGPYLLFDCAHSQHESQGGASLYNKVRWFVGRVPDLVQSEP